MKEEITEDQIKFGRVLLEKMREGHYQARHEEWTRNVTGDFSSYHDEDLISMVTPDDLREKPLQCGWCGSDPIIDRVNSAVSHYRCSNKDCPAHKARYVSLKNWNYRA